MPYSYWSLGEVLISFPKAEPVGVNTTIVCDAWPVPRQTYGYLPGLRWYQIYTAWWQLTAQDINPIAYMHGFAWHNFASSTWIRTGAGTTDQASEHVLSIAVTHATATLSRQ